MGKKRQKMTQSNCDHRVVGGHQCALKEGNNCDVLRLLYQDYFHRY